MRQISILLLILLITGCKNENNCIIQNPAELNDGLKVSTVEEHHIDTVLLSGLNSDICTGKYGKIHSLLIIKDGDLIVEQYYRKGKRDELHFLASVTKSFTAILTGIAIEKGYIDSLNQRMISFFPEYESNETDTLKHEITIEHLLTMTSGFEWDELSLPFSNPNNDGVRIDKMDDRLHGSLMLKMDTIPGSKYVYCGPNDIILGEIIKSTSKQNIAKFAEEHLFKILKIKEYEWYSKNGVYATAGGLRLKSRDMAKFGLLHLNEGTFGNTSVVSKNWIDETFTPYIEINKALFSGYQWRISTNKEGLLTYYIAGNGGQLILLAPDLNMVFVVTADNRNEPKPNRLPLKHLGERLLKIHPKNKN